MADVTVQELGSFGEVVAAIATVATLIYLSLQIRQTNRVSRSAVVSELQQKYIDFYNVVLTSDNFSELLAKLTDREYKAENESENQKLETFAILLYSIWFSVQTSFDQGQIDRKTYQAYCEDVVTRLGQWPAMKPYLVQASQRYPSTANNLIVQPLFEKETRV